MAVQKTHNHKSHDDKNMDEYDKFYSIPLLFRHCKLSWQSS